MLNPRDESLGSQIDDVRRGLATKSSTPCKSLVYLVVHPSLIHIITLKYARTLHKRRPRDARTNAPPHAHTHHRRAARSHVCRHVCSNMQAHAIMLSSNRSCPNSPQMWDGAQGVARAADRGAGAARCTARREACQGGKGGERSGEAKVSPAHLVELVLAAPTPRTGGGDRPPLWVQRRAWLSSGAHGRAGETGGAHRACGSIALRPRSRPNPFPNPPGLIPFQKAGDVHVVPAAASST